MATAADILTFVLVFLIGFVCGKLFASIQLAAMRTAARINQPEAAARRSVDTLMRLGKRL
ncbi:hypothetical protein HYU16_01240 [Candidatus Woesearchaeota archaeon]|nr:hypothetical protein [Candidatus Woesearchaeota archaeon]